MEFIYGSRTLEGIAMFKSQWINFLVNSKHMVLYTNMDKVIIEIKK